MFILLCSLTKKQNPKHFNRAVRHWHENITFFFFQIYLFSVVKVWWCCLWTSTVQTLYIFYYCIVVYIYCMHLSGQKATYFMVFYCWLWKIRKQALIIIQDTLLFLWKFRKWHSENVKLRNPSRLQVGGSSQGRKLV